MHTIQEQLVAVESSMKAGCYAEAEAICRELLSQEVLDEDKVNVLIHLSESLLRRGLSGEALPIAQQALALAQEIKSKSLEVKALNSVGSVLHSLSDCPSALESLKQAYALSKELQDTPRMANCLTNIGILYWRLSDYSLALENLHQALAIEERLDNQEGLAKNLGNLGLVYWQLADYTSALEYYHQALAINKRLNNKQSIASNLGNIGNVYIHLSEYSRSLEYHLQSLAIAEELGNKISIAVNLGNIGLVYKELSDYSRALGYFQQALDLNEELGRKSNVANNLGNIGLIYDKLSDFPRALEYLHLALSINEEIGNKSGAAMNLGNIGVIYDKLSDYPQALQYLNRALSMNEELGKKNNVANNLGSIAIVYENLCNYPLSFKYCCEALAIAEEVGNKSSIAINTANLGRLLGREDFAEYNPRIAEEHLLKAISTMVELGVKRSLYDAYQVLSQLYAQQERWKEHAEYLKKYYETKEEVQTEEVKKQADKFAFERQIAVMEKEREVTDLLLQKTFPSAIVPSLKAGNTLIMEEFKSASVLFADLVGFTKLSLVVSPKDMVKIFNFIFTHFDIIMKNNGCERLRTIGDGYMAIAGAPVKAENHAYLLARAAKEMAKEIPLPPEIASILPEGTALSIRIGLHCGTLIAGIVGGLEKWQYDIYGDSVNTASRMESHGEPGKIHISEDFKNALADYPEFTFIPRKPMTIKGKGIMNTFFLE